MDDPWGSPWANNEDSKPSSTSLTLEPPPRVLLSAKPSPASSNNNLSISSPWANEDDGPGDWGGIDTATTPNSTSLNPWASWGDSNQQHSPRRESPRKESLTVWPAAASAATSPSLRPLPRSRAPSSSTVPTLSRQPSFDPWKSDISLKTSDEEMPTPNIQVDSSHGKSSGGVVPEDLEIKHPSQETGKDPEPFSTTTKALPDPTSNTSTREKKVGTNVNNHHSRPSSRSSDSSGRDDFARDSPITSVDENVRVASDHRKASTKVQDLVHMFDDLAKQDDDAEIPLTKEPTKRKNPGPNGSAEGEGDDEFGDFEDATDDGEEEATNKTQCPVAQVPARTKTEYINVEIDIPFDQLDMLFPMPEGSSESTAKGHKRSESFEHTIYDTFTETSQRRTWYRISRFGSMLRNDAPDFENYTSVSWPNTKVHDETLATVRRWMLGDKLGSYGTDLAGNASNGGRGGGFGWDSAATPTVSMEDIFGRRKKPTHISTASASRIQAPTVNTAPIRSPIGSSPNTATFGWSTSPTEPTAPAPSKRPVSLHQQQPSDILHRKQASNPWATGSVESPPLAPPATIPENSNVSDASFGWGSLDALDTTEQSAPAVSINATPLEQNHTGAAHVGGDPQHEQSISTWDPSPPVSSTSNKFSNNNGTDDDDDDWGDMVSSPAVDTVPPPFPLSAIIPKSTPTSTPTTIPISMPIPPESVPPKETSVEPTMTAEEERVVHEIVSNLPDLSWMLQ